LNLIIYLLIEQLITKYVWPVDLILQTRFAICRKGPLWSW